MTKQSWTAAIGFGVALLAGASGASAQGVNERMVTGAPAYTIHVPPPEAKRPTAVPTAPNAYRDRAYPPSSRRDYRDYWNWPRSQAKKLQPDRR